MGPRSSKFAKVFLILWGIVFTASILFYLFLKYTRPVEASINPKVFGAIIYSEIIFLFFGLVLIGILNILEDRGTI